jgi:hypothetical protein
MSNNSALTGVFSFLGWSFIPGYATSFVQTLYYKLTIRAGSPTPQPGTALYAQHHRRIRIFVLCLYLFYTLLQGLNDLRIAGDFYTALGVTPYSSDREVKARFRRLAAKFHPDKVSQYGDASPTADALFVQYKLAQDTILDSVKRFAYDRFGPKIVQTQQPGMKTIRDYVLVGLRSLVPEYTVGAVSLVALNYFYFPKWGQYWRLYAISTLVFLELYFLTHAFEPPSSITQFGKAAQMILPDLLPPHLLPFQILSLARKLSISLNIFISQLAPPAARSKADEDRQTQQQIAHLNQAACRLDQEATGLLNFGFAPFKGDAEKVTMLRKGMKDGVVQGAVRNSPEVRDAVRRAIDRRKEQWGS